MPSMPSYTRNALVGPPFTFYLFAWTWAVCAKRARPRGDNVQGTRVFPQTSPHPLFALYPNFHDYIELAFPQTRFLVAHNHFFAQYPPSTATHKAHISRNPASFN